MAEEVTRGIQQEKHLTDPVLVVLVEGEQRLLAVFDARQASADAKLTAALTGALALPTATVALAGASSLSAHPVVLRGGYAAVVGAVILLLVFRLWNGGRWRKRVEGEDIEPPLSSVSGPSPGEAPREGTEPPMTAVRDKATQVQVEPTPRHQLLKFSTESEAAYKGLP